MRELSEFLVKILLLPIGPLSLNNVIMPNGNGYLSLKVASSFKLIYVSSQIRMRDSKRWTRRHSCYRSRAVIDHVFYKLNRFVSSSVVVLHQTFLLPLHC